MTFQAVVVSITLHIFLQIVKGYFFFYTLRNILLIHLHTRKLQPLSKTFIYLKVLGRERGIGKIYTCNNFFAYISNL